MLQLTVGSILLAAALSARPVSDLPRGIQIPRFQRVAEGLYRGGQPDWTALVVPVDQAAGLRLPALDPKFTRDGSAVGDRLIRGRRPNFLYFRNSVSVPELACRLCGYEHPLVEPQLRHL